MKILAFCGSLRSASLNRRLLVHTCNILKEKGCEVTFKDLRALEIPLYDGDLEDKSGLPTGVSQLVEAMNNSDGFVIGNPEYNGGITGVLKNTIDWASRAEKNPFVGKNILLVGTSPGWWGAVKANMITRHILTHLRAYVVPAQITIPQGDTNLDEKGLIKQPGLEKALVGACDELIKLVKSSKS